MMSHLQSFTKYIETNGQIITRLLEIMQNCFHFTRLKQCCGGDVTACEFGTLSLSYLHKQYCLEVAGKGGIGRRGVVLSFS